MATRWRLGSHHGCGRRSPKRGHSDDRLLLGSGASARRRGKKGVSDHCMGRSRGGLTTKIHALVEGRGLPLRLVLTGGQVHDTQAAAELLAALPQETVVVADKGYDADWIRELIESQDAAPNIPAKSSRRQRFCFSKRLYRERNLIERFFNKLK